MSIPNNLQIFHYLCKNKTSLIGNMDPWHTFIMTRVVLSTCPEWMQYVNMIDSTWVMCKWSPMSNRKCVIKACSLVLFVTKLSLSTGFEEESRVLTLLWAWNYLPGGCTTLNMYDYMWLHNRDIILNIVVLRKHMLNSLKLVVMHMYGGPLKYVQHLYLYGTVTRL